ncbi:MAG TPA: hypothetical protein VJY33_06855, partial [Isosphaeraceae bacterium]|nr:hypothetical protein [Isosphaeraceae bacterium]
SAGACLLGFPAAQADAAPTAPVSVYITWAAHDELSDSVPLDESLAMRELAAVTRLKAQGARFDYFLLDMPWFDKDGGFRTFRKASWPSGPDRFLAACREQGLKPGLWLSTNVCGWSADPWLTPRPEWRDSRGGYMDLAMSLHGGGFLAYQIETMQQWYDRGVRLFKFDFANLGAAPASELARLGRHEVERLNTEAWRNALRAFRERNPDVLLIAYNGYGGETGDTSPGFSKTVDRRWLEAFDSLYCGDPKPADVPCANFWRSLDVYSDAMVFQYSANGIPLSRVDSSGFMIGNTGTCYRRGKAAWKGTLILSAARGGLVNTYYGDLTLLDERDRAWFAKVQRLYYPLQALGETATFGGYPGAGGPYGFVARGPGGAVCTVLNPGLTAGDVALSLPPNTVSRLLFTDAGPAPVIGGGAIRLGPGQMAVVGTGAYADTMWDLGIQDDVVIPESCEPLKLSDVVRGPRSVSATVRAPRRGGLRIACNQFGKDGRPWRVSGGSPPSGVPLGKLLVLKAEQGGRELETSCPYDRQIWSGLSWAVADVPAKEMEPGAPVRITYTVGDPKGNSGTVDIRAFAVSD